MEKAKETIVVLQHNSIKFVVIANDSISHNIKKHSKCGDGEGSKRSVGKQKK